MSDLCHPALVARLADVFGKSDGDLRQLATALLDSDEAWKAPLTKVRSPYEFLVAGGRLLAQIPGDPGRYLNGLNVLGTTGEATSFSLEQRKAVMSAYKAAGLPLDRLMVGTGAAATSDAVASSRRQPCDSRCLF